MNIFCNYIVRVVYALQDGRGFNNLLRNCEYFETLIGLENNLLIVAERCDGGHVLN